MAACVYADDAYLIGPGHFPGVVVRSPESWVVTVLASAVGNYTVTLGGAGYVYPGVLGQTAGDIADGLLGVLGASLLVAVSPTGAASVVVQAVSSTALDLTVSGPAVDTIEATLISGGDTNADARAEWLERAKCGLPPCACVPCEGDFTLMHAALAAHWLYTLGNVSGTGSGANDFDAMRLGPASLTKGKTAWSANPADADLATTAAGKLFLWLRSKYVMNWRCG
jgi:hypothetical protein